MLYGRIAAHSCVSSPGDMLEGFVQRGGLWVLVQSALLLAVAGLGMVCRNESKHFILFLGGLFFLALSALCGIAGVVALGRNLTPFPKPSVLDCNFCGSRGSIPLGARI